MIRQVKSFLSEDSVQAVSILLAISAIAIVGAVFIAKKRNADKKEVSDGTA